MKRKHVPVVEDVKQGDEESGVEVVSMVDSGKPEDETRADHDGESAAAEEEKEEEEIGEEPEDAGSNKKENTKSERNL